MGMGAGRREALWPGGEAFKGGGWEGPNSGAAPTRPPFGRVSPVFPSGGRCVLGAHGVAG